MTRLKRQFRKYLGHWEFRQPHVSLSGEIIAILVLAGIIALYFWLPYATPSTRTAVRRVLADLSTICNAVDRFRLDCGRYPTQSEGLLGLYVRPQGVKGWAGPYLMPPLPCDAWGFPYHYRTPGPTGSGYQVASYGADGLPGGNGDNEDLTDGS